MAEDNHFIPQTPLFPLHSLPLFVWCSFRESNEASIQDCSKKISGIRSSLDFGTGKPSSHHRACLGVSKEWPWVWYPGTSCPGGCEHISIPLRLMGSTSHQRPLLHSLVPAWTTVSKFSISRAGEHAFWTSCSLSRVEWGCWCKHWRNMIFHQAHALSDTASLWTSSYFCPSFSLHLYFSSPQKAKWIQEKNPLKKLV